MSKDKITTEQNFETVLERTNVDSKALLIRTPFDNLKIKKNLDQLYHTLKRKNEEEKTIPEELRARNIFRLSQAGIECSKIAQTLIHEQYFINKKKEEKETQSTNQFATNLGEDYDITSYIQKYTDFMLFNLTDHAYIQSKTRTQKQVISKLNGLWANDVKKLIESKKVQSDSLISTNKLLPQGRPRTAIKRKSKGITDKKANYLNSLNKYMRLKYMDREDNEVYVSSTISEFVAFTRGNPEVCELWRILEAQVSTFERTTSEFRNSTNILDRDLNDKQQNLNQRRAIYCNLVSVTCQLLEEEFLTQIQTQNKSTISYIRQTDADLTAEDRDFIIQEYLDNSNFRRRNYIEFDEKSLPVWAICYVLFRTGRLKDIREFVTKYDGSLKGDLVKFNQFLTEYREEKGEIDPDSKQNMLQSLDSGEQDIDVFKKMLYCVLTKSQDIPSEDLLARLGDYLWFNLKVCNPLQTDSLDGRGLRISSNTLTLFDVQKEILRYPSSHFNPGNSIPLNYVKTLFILEAYDEALHFLRAYENYYEEFIHFAIVLYESGLINLRWESTEPEKYGFNYFKDNDYCREIIEYATSFCEKNPLESALYLRLLWPNKETSGENMKKKELIIETITNFIITNDQVTLFFDKTREAQRNARYLEDIVGSEIYRKIVLGITRHYRKSKLQVAILLLDKIEFYADVLELILEEEYENLRVFKERSKGRDISISKSPYESFFNDILDTYGRKNILNKYRFTYTAYEFVRKVKSLWESYAKKNYNDAFELLKKWNHEWYIFGFHENEILEEFSANHDVVQKCYLDLLLISSKIIKEYRNYVRNTAKTDEQLKLKLSEASQLWTKVSNFYKKVKKRFISDPAYIQTLKDLDNEIEYNPSFSSN